MCPHGTSLLSMSYQRSNKWLAGYIRIRPYESIQTYLTLHLLMYRTQRQFLNLDLLAKSADERRLGTADFAVTYLILLLELFSQ